MLVVKDTDDILVLNSREGEAGSRVGRIVQNGIHESLLEEKGGHYVDLWERQFGERYEVTVEEMLETGPDPRS